MKKKVGTLCALMALVLISCTKEVDYASVLNTVRAGTWRVDYYSAAGSIETERFNGYNFTFNPDSSLHVQKENTDLYGSYTVSNGGNSTQLNLYFTDDVLADLVREWHVTNLSETRLETENTANTQVPPTYLYFQRN